MGTSRGYQIAKRDLHKENIFPVADFHCQLLKN